MRSFSIEEEDVPGDDKMDYLETQAIEQIINYQWEKTGAKTVILNKIVM